jgi:glutathione S-transferase
VPTLIHNGVPVIESSVICEYIEDVFPASALVPANSHDRARMRVWAKWTDEIVIRAFQVANWNRMMASVARQWSDAEVERELSVIPVPYRREDWRRMARELFSDADIAHAIANIRRTLERMEHELAVGPWMADRTFSLADIHLSLYIVRIEEHAGRGVYLNDYPRCKDWWERLSARPPFERARIEPMVFDGLECVGTELSR